MTDKVDVTIKDLSVETVQEWLRGDWMDVGHVEFVSALCSAARAALARLEAGEPPGISEESAEAIRQVKALAVERVREEGATVEEKRSVEVDAGDLAAMLDDLLTLDHGAGLNPHVRRLRAALAEHEVSKKPRYGAYRAEIGWVVYQYDTPGHVALFDNSQCPNAEAEAKALCARLNGEDG